MLTLTDLPLPTSLLWRPYSHIHTRFRCLIWRLKPNFLVFRWSWSRETDSSRGVRWRFVDVRADVSCVDDVNFTPTVKSLRCCAAPDAPTAENKTFQSAGGAETLERKTLKSSFGFHYFYFYYFYYESFAFFFCIFTTTTLSSFFSYVSWNRIHFSGDHGNWWFNGCGRLSCTRSDREKTASYIYILNNIVFLILSFDWSKFKSSSKAV